MDPLTGITTALGGLKTAGDLAKSVREGVKASKIKPDEVARQISEIQDLIMDGKDALNNSKDEIVRLKGELAKLTDLQDNFEFRDNVYYRKGTNVAYCPLCLKADHKLVPLTDYGDQCLYCAIHKHTFEPPPPVGFARSTY
jgi:hypothetical protein